MWYIKITFSAVIMGVACVAAWFLYHGSWVSDEAVVIDDGLDSSIRSYFEPLYKFELGRQQMFASIADTDEERQLGLSNTDSLPSDIAKVFIFPNEDRWSFWMKDMRYAIDIIWVSAAGEIVHIESSVRPESYPASFVPTKVARYVIETNAGFVDSHGLQVGSFVSLEELLVQL